MFTALFIALLAPFAVGQYGSAPNNYYPDNYGGSTFTGTVAEGKDDQVTLTYTNKDKTQTFTGRFETSCSIPTRNGQPMTASDLTPGTVLTAFYNRESKKVAGQKQQENVILAIAFIVWQGQKVGEDKRKIYLCTSNHHLQFRAWN